MYKELGKLGLSQASTESEDPEYDMEQYGGGWVTGTESLGEVEVESIGSIIRGKMTLQFPIEEMNSTLSRSIFPSWCYFMFIKGRHRP